MTTEDQLSEHESRIAQAARSGQLVDWRSTDTGLEDPANGADWDETRCIRAEFLIDLLTAERAADNGRNRAIKIRGARIVGQLDLEASVLMCPLLLHDCYIEDPINLDEATAPAIRLPGCYITSLSAAQLRTTGSLDLSEGFTAKGEVFLAGAHIGGQFLLGGASLSNEQGRALTAHRISVGHDMLCVDGFAAAGEVNLAGAHIGGELSLEGASLNNPGGHALSAEGLTVDESMLCINGFSAVGEVDLVGAQVGGMLMLNGASLKNAGGYALSADRLTVDQSLQGFDGFTVEGEVRLASAHIGDILDLSSASLKNPGGYALNADRLTVDQSIFCMDGFTVEGKMSMIGAHVSGQLALNGATLSNPGGDALRANGLTVEQDMFCLHGFTAAGQVDLAGARIGGQLGLNGATLNNPGGSALHADGLTVEQDMFCQNGFTANGEVSLQGAQLRSSLLFKEASLNNPDGCGWALNLRRANIAHLSLLLAQPPDGGIDFTNARVGVFDDAQPTWPRFQLLRGFTYETMGNEQITVRDRLRWLKLQTDGYSPQIYDQLAAAYRRAGHIEAARTVGVTKQWRRRSPLNPFNWLMYLTVGYGYRTWLSGLWLAALAILGDEVFTRTNTQNLMRASSGAPTFHPLAYALDVLLPIVDLGQEKAWTAQGWALYWSWSLIAAGWVLTTAAVAGLTGILKRD
ncbi:hypothetical protein ACRYCC_32755 [Actinomadura scrupuli]|uniref:hypothetical protein n=1 Tax=Actinomadura scrupuli TaxID=559629 RepID=UPI003D9A081C